MRRGLYIEKKNVVCLNTGWRASPLVSVNSHFQVSRGTSFLSQAAKLKDFVSQIKCSRISPCVHEKLFKAIG